MDTDLKETGGRRGDPIEELRRFLAEGTRPVEPSAENPGPLTIALAQSLKDKFGDFTGITAEVAFHAAGFICGAIDAHLYQDALSAWESAERTIAKHDEWNAPRCSTCNEPKRRFDDRWVCDDCEHEEHGEMPHDEQER
jgi:hypothetical protein